MIERSRIGALVRCGSALAVAIVLAGAPAHAVVVCQKTANPNKIKVRRECKDGETAVAVNDVYFASAGTADLVDNADPIEVVALPLPPGRYLVEATMRVSASVVELATCTLTVGDATDSATRLIDGNELVGDPHDLVTMVAVELGTAGAATVSCRAFGGGDPGAILQNVRIVAQAAGRLVETP
jgi:hypothetical protein